MEVRISSVTCAHDFDTSITIFVDLLFTHKMNGYCQYILLSLPYSLPSDQSQWAIVILVTQLCGLLSCSHCTPWRGFSALLTIFQYNFCYWIIFTAFFFSLCSIFLRYEVML